MAQNAPKTDLKWSFCPNMVNKGVSHRVKRLIEPKNAQKLVCFAPDCIMDAKNRLATARKCLR